MGGFNKNYESGFDFFEAFAVDALDVGLRDKGLFVDAFDEAEDHGAFFLFRYDYEDFDRCFCEAAFAV